MLDGFHFGDLYIPTGNLSGVTGTVAAKKAELVSYFSKYSTGIGANATVGQSLIVNWDNESVSLYPSSVYSVIKIGGGYEGTTYGQWLLSSYNLSQVGIVGRNNSVWSSIKWLAYLDDNVASATKLQTARIIFGQSFDGTGDITGRMTASDIELYAATPFIDFHHGSSTTDYTSRLITTDATTLNCTSNFSVGGNIYGLGTVRGTAVNNNYNQGSFEAQGNGSANTVKPSYGFHQPGVYGGRLVQESENEFSFYNTSGARANLNIGRLSAEGGIICSAIINSGNIITAGNIHSSSGTISAGEGVDNAYGFINVTRPDGTGTNWTQSCFSMVRQGKSPFGIGFNGNNSILLGGATTQKTINSWIEINSSYTSADNIRALSSLRIGANDVVNGTTTITSTNAGAVFNTLGTTFGFNKPVYITGGLDLIDMLTIDNRIVANVKCAIKADRTAMSYSTESASHSFNKKITVTGDILVSANDIYNLGSSTNRFNIGYIKTLASNAISTSSLSTDTFNVYTGANISGYVIINNNITISGQADINKLIMPYSAGAWINMAYSSAISGKIPTSTSSAHVLYRLIDSGGNAIAFGGLGTSLGFYGFYKSAIDAGTNAYNWRTYWDTSSGIFVQGGDMFIGDGRNGAYLQIGNMRLAYDQANNAMKLTNGVNGVANFYSTGGMSSKGSSSDIRLKKDLTQYDALDIIRGHRSLMYHWNDTAKANSEIFRTDKWQFGLIAQDLIDNGYGQLTSDIFKDYLIIDYERLIPIVWRGVQQVDNEVTILKRRISNLEKELEQLKKQSA